MKQLKLFAALSLLIVIAMFPVWPQAPAVPSSSESEAYKNYLSKVEYSDTGDILYPKPPKEDIAQLFTVSAMVDLLDIYMEQQGYGKVSEWDFSYNYEYIYHYNENVSIEFDENRLTGRLNSIYVRAYPEGVRYSDAVAEGDLAVFDALDAYFTDLFNLSEVIEYMYSDGRIGDLFSSSITSGYGKRLTITPNDKTIVPIKTKPLRVTDSELIDALDSISTSAGRRKVSEWQDILGYWLEMLTYTERFTIATHYTTDYSGGKSIRKPMQIDLIFYKKAAAENDAEYFFDLAKGVIRLLEPTASEAVIAKLQLDERPGISMAHSRTARYQYIEDGNLMRLLINTADYHRGAFTYTRAGLIRFLNEAIANSGIYLIDSSAVTEISDNGTTASRYRIDEGCCLTLYEDETGYVTEAMLHYSDDLAGLDGRQAYEPLLKQLVKALEPDNHERIWNYLDLDNFKITDLGVTEGARSHSQYMVFNDERNFRIWSLD